MDFKKNIYIQRLQNKYIPSYKSADVRLTIIWGAMYFIGLFLKQVFIYRTIIFLKGKKYIFFFRYIQSVYKLSS